MDLLILGQSQIVGFSGSTFQNVARLLGQHAPITALGMPPPIAALALLDILRWTNNKQLSLIQVCEYAEAMRAADRTHDALEILRAALEVFAGADQYVLLHNMASYLLGMGCLAQAAIYASAASNIIPGSPQIDQLLTRIRAAQK